jgi:hypothetical protein
LLILLIAPLLLLLLLCCRLLPLSVEKTPHYRAINWGEFRRKRFEGGQDQHLQRCSKFIMICERL